MKELHDALQNAKDHGDPIVGDISEEALAQELESSGLDPQAGDGCSTPDATKKLTQKYDKVFRAACDKHDVCYMPNSPTDRKDCDEAFGRDMVNICKKNPQGDETQCRRMAAIYKAAVRAGGESSYKGKGKNN